MEVNRTSNDKIKNFKGPHYCSREKKECWVGGRALDGVEAKGK